jgi:hypothetical protein
MPERLVALDVPAGLQAVHAGIRQSMKTMS